MKVIFIDVDGPLAWGTWGDGEVKIMEGTSAEFTIPYSWVKEDCDALCEIIKQTDARLVVSSDWKKHFGILQLAMIFEHYGIGRWNVMDITTHFNPRKKMSSSFIDDIRLNFGYKSLGIPQWHHVQVDGDWGNGGRLRDKVDECVKKLNK